MVRFSVKIFQSFKVSCMVPNIGAAGGNQQHNGLCELTQVYMACATFYLSLFFRTSSMGKSTSSSGSGSASLFSSLSSLFSTDFSPSSPTHCASTCSTKRWNFRHTFQICSPRSVINGTKTSESAFTTCLQNARCVVIMEKIFPLLSLVTGLCSTSCARTATRISSESSSRSLPGS